MVAEGAYSMALNLEQLTQRVNELIDGQTSLRNELTRRGLEHQGEHTLIEQLRSRLDQMERSAGRGLKVETRSILSARTLRWRSGLIDGLHPIQAWYFLEMTVRRA